MARGGHGLPKVSPGPAMPYPSTPCGWTTPETALRLFQEWPARRAGGLRPSFYPFGHPTLYACGDPSVDKIVTPASKFIHPCIKVYSPLHQNLFTPASKLIHPCIKIERPLDCISRNSIDDMLVKRIFFVLVSFLGEKKLKTERKQKSFTVYLLLTQNDHVFH
jgi:hypothetical protein